MGYICFQQITLYFQLSYATAKGSMRNKPNLSDAYETIRCSAKPLVQALHKIQRTLRCSTKLSEVRYEVSYTFVLPTKLSEVWHEINEVSRCSLKLETVSWEIYETNCHFFCFQRSFVEKVRNYLKSAELKVAVNGKDRAILIALN